MGPKEPSSNLAYRPEIDGLRALAVIPVVLYHAGVAIPGGYAGVDVFFVISGYLIASILIREHGEGRFRYGVFWGRRLRRLFPAWFAMIVVTTGVAAALLIPAHLADFGESLLSQPTLTANFHFWERTGYFEPESDWQPLLHTWSLAVEEQFYLFFPIVFAPLLLRGKRTTRSVVAILSLVSLALSIYFTTREPEFAFFLLPARIWELNAGVLLALFPGLVARFGSRWRELLGAGGVVMIGLSFFAFDQNTDFPGHAAMLPCLGTVFVLAANEGSTTRTGRVLSLPLPVWIGKISYPLYLWHWPCLALLHYWSLDDPSHSATAVACGLSLVLAWATYRWIERPVREKRVISSRRALCGWAAAGAGLVVAVGWILISTEGLPSRFRGLGSFGIEEIRRPVVTTIERWDEKGGPTRLGDTSATDAHLLVWGDSHALALSRVFDELGKAHGVKVTIAAMAGVAPVLGAYPAAKGPDVTRFADRVVKLIRDEGIREVIIVAKWPMYLTGRSGGELDRILRDGTERSDEPEEAIEVFLRRFPETLEQLRAEGCRVRVLRTVPQQPYSVPEALARIHLRGDNPDLLALPASIHAERDALENGILDRAMTGSEAEILDPLPFLTNQAGIVPMAREGKAVYRDRDHLSPYGSLMLAPLLEPVFAGIGSK